MSQKMPRVAPLRRGKRWVARYPRPDGTRLSAGTYAKKGPCAAEAMNVAGEVTCCAQHAIDRALERAWGTGSTRTPDTFGAYATTWTRRHPRATRTNRTNDGRVRAVLDVVIDGRPLRAWPFGELRRRHAVDLVDVLLADQGRAATGAQNVLRSLSAMAEDAITDEVCDTNPFKGVKVRASDVRVVKAPKVMRVHSWQTMHAFAAAAADARTPRHVLVPDDDAGVEVRRPASDGRVLSYRLEASEMDRWRPVYAQAMVRTIADCGLRIGEVPGLERRDVFTGACDRDGCGITAPHLHVRGSAHEGVFVEGDQPTKRHVRAVPLPDDLAGLLAGLPARLDTRLLFPSPRGRMWRERNFYRDVWNPARDVSGVAATPHEFRHSWVSHLRAGGVDHADLADAAGHTVETATKRYTHALGRSFDAIREAVGE